MARRRAAGALLALAACVAYATAAPTSSNHTALDLYDGAPDGCYYNFQHYGEGDRIMTNEPCLNCTCHNRMLMCYLRVCPFTKPIGQDCTIEKRADQCCPIVTCPDVPVDLLTSTTNSPAEYGASGLGKLDKYGCSIHGKYFSEGSKVPPTPNKPCEHCYCIRNMTTCVMQECTLHVDGCTPIYHKDVCCPVRYSCDHPEDEMPLLDDLSTTVRPTPGFLLTTTTLSPVTQMSQDCLYENKIIPDGALIKTEKACDHCYCMKGDIVCVVQECGTPMENEGKNCTALPPREGVCCPDTYICEGDESTTGPNEEQDFTTEIYQEKLTTLTPPRRAGSEGSGYRIEPDDIHNTESPYDSETEGSGDEQATIHPTVVSEALPESHKIEPTDETAISTEEPHEFIPAVSTLKPVYEYDGVTTVKEDHKEISEPQVTSTSTDLISKEGDESTTVKTFDEDIGSGEDEISTSQVTIPSSSDLPAIEDSEPTVASEQGVATTESDKEDSFVKEVMTEIPSIEKETKVNIPSDQDSVTEVSIETTTQSRRYLDEEDSTKTPTIVHAEALITESDLLQRTTIVPIFESDARKTTQAVERESTTLYETDSKKPFDPEQNIVTVSTSAPGFEDEISTESQDIITDDNEGTIADIDPNRHATVTASTPLLEEIEKETTEQESIPNESTSDKYITSTIQSNIPTETVDTTTDFIDETISTSIPTTDSVPENIDISITESQGGPKKDKQESSQPQEQSFTDHQESENTETTQSGEMVTSEPQRSHDTFIEESSGSQEYPSTTLASVYEKEIEKTTESGILINSPEGQIDDDIQQTDLSRATTLQQSEITTAEPDKGLNTIPSGTMDDETTESSEKDKITPVDDKRIYDLTTELENKFDDHIDTVTDSSIRTTLDETSVSDEDQLILTTKPAIKEVDGSKTVTVHEITEPTTKLSDIAETTQAHDHSSKTEASPLEHPESYSPVVTETIDNLEQTTDSVKPTFTSSYEPITEATGSESDVTPSKLETSSFETISESTSVNLEENEIDNEPRIPGEGDCLLNGVTYRNESTVPNTNKCQSGCKCVSSIIKCDPIICSPPPKYMDNCHATYDSPNSCCPTYVCDHKAETMPPQSHSQISGTEAPVMPPIKCHGDECVINEDQSVEITELCESGKCSGQSETGFSHPSHIPEQPEIDHKECVGEKCIQTTNEPVKPCEGNECEVVSPTKLTPCADGEDCDVPVKECNGKECKSDTEMAQEKPHDLPCEGNECGIVSDNIPPHKLQPCANGEDCDVPVKECQGDDCSSDNDKFEKKPHDKICENPEDCETETKLDDIEKECTESSCKEKHDSGVNQQGPCSGSECEPTEITPDLELTTASTLTSQKDLESDKVTDNIDIVTEKSSELPSQDSDQSTKLIENVTDEPGEHEIVHADTGPETNPDISSTVSSEITTSPEIDIANEFTTESEAKLTESPLPHQPISTDLDEEKHQTDEPIHSTGIRVTDKEEDTTEDNVMNTSDIYKEQTTEISASLEQQEVTKPSLEQSGLIKTPATKLPEQEITDDNEMFSESTKTPLIETSEMPTTEIINTETPKSIETDTETEIIKQEEQHSVTMEPHIPDQTKSSDDAETTILDIADKVVTESSKPSEGSQDVTISQQETEKDITTRRTIETGHHLATESSNPDDVQPLESTKSPDAFNNEKNTTEITNDLETHLSDQYTTPQSSEMKDTVTEQFIPTDSPLDLVTKQVTHDEVTAHTYVPSEDDKHITTVVPVIQDSKMPSSTEDETIPEDSKTEAPLLHETMKDTTDYVSPTLKPTDYTDVSNSVDKATEHLETTTSPKEVSTETLETIKEPSEEQQPEKTLIPVSISTEQPYVESDTKLPIDSEIEEESGSHTYLPATDVLELSPTEPSVMNIPGKEEMSTETSVEKTENENKLVDNIPQNELEGGSLSEKPTEEDHGPEILVITEKPAAEVHEHEASVNDDLSTASPVDNIESTEKPTNEEHESKTPVSDNLSTIKPADDVEITEKPSQEVETPETPEVINLSTEEPEDVVDITEKPVEDVQEPEATVSDNLSTETPVDKVKITEKPAQEDQEPGTNESDHLSTVAFEDNVEITMKPIDVEQESEHPVTDILSTEAPVDEVKITDEPTKEEQEPEVPVSDNLSTMAPVEEITITEKSAEKEQESGAHTINDLSTIAPKDEAKVTEKPNEVETQANADLSTVTPLDDVDVTEKPTEEIQITEAPVRPSTEAPVDEAKMTDKPAAEEQEPYEPVSDNLSTMVPPDEIIITAKPAEGMQKPETPLRDNVSSEVPVDEVSVTEKPTEDVQASEGPVSDNLSTDSPLDNLTEKPVEVQESEAPISDHLSTTEALDEEKITEKPVQEAQQPESPLSDNLSTAAPKDEDQYSKTPEEGQESEAPGGDNISTLIPEDNVDVTMKPADEIQTPDKPVSDDSSTAVPADDVKTTEIPTVEEQEHEALVNDNLTTRAPVDQVKITEKPAKEEQETDVPVNDNLSTMAPVEEITITEKPAEKEPEKPEVPFSDNLSTMAPVEEITITEKPAEKEQNPEVPVSDNLSTMAPVEEITITEKPAEKEQQPGAYTIDDLSTIAPEDEFKVTEKPVDKLKESGNEEDITEKPTLEVESETPISDHLSTARPEDKSTESEPTESDKIEIETSTRRDSTGGVRTETPDTSVEQESTTEHRLSTDIPKLVTEIYTEDPERKTTTESPAATQEDEMTMDVGIKTPPQGDFTLHSTTTETVHDFTKPQDLEGIKEIEAATAETDKMSTTSSVFQSTEAAEVIETSTKSVEIITHQPDEAVTDLEHTLKQENDKTTTSGKIEDEHISLIDREETKTPIAVTDVTQAPLIDTATSKQEITTESSDEDLPSRTYRPETSDTSPEDLPEKQTDASVLIDDATVSPVESILTSTESHITGEDHHTTFAPDKTSTTTVEEQTKNETTPSQNQPEPSSETSVPVEKTTTTKPTTPKTEKVTTSSPLIDRFTKPTPKPTEVPAPEQPRPIPTEEHPTDDVPTIDDESSVPPSGSSGYGQETDYVDEDPTFGPGTCRYGGKVYVSAQQIPRDDPCDFCFCFRSDIICLQQSCPPPIQGCHEEPIQGFCCPRYECPVSMATTVNVTTTTTTTTTTLPPHFPIHSYKGSAQKRGCLIKGHTYKVGEVVRASSGPCLHCTCGGDGQMKCDPKQCTPEPMLRQMIAAAVSAKRRR